MDKDQFGDRMKFYENQEASRCLDVTLPIAARIDGRGFSKFTKGFERPFDSNITRAMRETCRHLVEKTHAKIGYVQSDEITLIWDGVTEDNSSIFFAGRNQKLCSVLASMATIKFAVELSVTHSEIVAERLPAFDARVWNVPSRVEAANVVLWRALDARKNAISMICRSLYSPKQMHGKNQDQMKQMIREAGVDYDSFPAMFTFGSYFRRQTKLVEIDPKYWKMVQEDGTDSRLVERTVITDEVPFRYFGDVLNRVDFIFSGQEAEVSD